MPVQFLPSKHEWKICQRLVTILPNRPRCKLCWLLNYRKQRVRTPATQETGKHDLSKQSRDQKDSKQLPQAANTNWTLTSTHLFPTAPLGNVGRTELSPGHYQRGLHWPWAQPKTQHKTTFGTCPCVHTHPTSTESAARDFTEILLHSSLQLLSEKLYFTK